MQELGRYDVAVIGAGISGVVASIASAREGARTLLVESSGMLGGLITGGRLSKPHGIVQPGVYREFIDRAAALGGGDGQTRVTDYGAYSGVFDPELMQRVVIESVVDAGVDVLLYAHATDVLTRGPGGPVSGVIVQTKSGQALVLSDVIVDTTGDGDVAALAGADFMFGRESDGALQPMTSYFRVANVDVPALIADCLAHPEDMYNLVLPDDPEHPSDEDRMAFHARGFAQRVAQARRDGLEWILPKDYVTLKQGMRPDEINVNATRVPGNALDPWERSGAAIAVRRQTYCVMEFMRQYVGGFEQSVILDIAPTLGVRETRRIIGDYVLSEADVSGEARFEDSIGLCNSAIDIHHPEDGGGTVISVGDGYAIPYRVLLPAGIDGMLVAGRCMSADTIAFASSRNTPGCALAGQAAGVAAAQAAAAHVSPRQIDITAMQDRLQEIGVVLGREEHEGLREMLAAVGA